MLTIAMLESSCRDRKLLDVWYSARDRFFSRRFKLVMTPAVDYAVNYFQEHFQVGLKPYNKTVGVGRGRDYWSESISYSK